MQTQPAAKKPAAKDWHKADIKAALERAGYTLRGLAAAHSLPPHHFQSALWVPRPKPEAVLAAVIGVPAHEIWPSRYQPDGTRRAGLHSLKLRAKDRETGTNVNRTKAESNAKVSAGV